MRCKPCWREACKTSLATGDFAPKIYGRRECSHGVRTTRQSRPELTLNVTVGPLTPLTELFPLGIPA